MSATIISFVNFKGGVGKTALAVNVATSLAHEFGEKVLLVDLDPQSCASIYLLGIPRWDSRANSQPHKTVYGLLKKQNPIGPCIEQVTVTDNEIVLVPKLHLLPSCYRLMDFEGATENPSGEPHYVHFWKEMMAMTGGYDFILIDCPPNLYRTTQCAIFASHHILVPCNPDALSVIGLALLGRKIKEFMQKTEAEHHEHRPGRRQASISGIIISNEPTTETKANSRADTLLKYKLQYLKGRGEATPTAQVLPVRIRHAADFRTGSFEWTPLRFAKLVTNKDLLADYRNLANHIRTTFKGDQ